jgi:hypothetical protein
MSLYPRAKARLKKHLGYSVRPLRGHWCLDIFQAVFGNLMDGRGHPARIEAESIFPRNDFVDRSNARQRLGEALRK